MRTVAMVLAVGLITATSLSAQTGAVEGRVVDASSGQPLSGVQVTLSQADREAVSDASGRFRFLDVRSGEQTVVASRLGYGTQERSIQVKIGQTVRLEVELSEEAVAVGGIRVTGRQGGFVATESASIAKVDAPLVEVPQSISVITRAQLALQDVSTIAEATRYTPGVRAEPWGFEPRLTFIQIRGFDATTTGLYRDGLQLSNPGYAVGYNLEPYGAERVEVLRGPASVLYGASNPGGLLNYVTKRPTTVPIAEVEMEVGTFERVQGKFDVGGPVGDAFGYRVTGLARSGGTQIDFVENDRLFVAPTFTWSPTDATNVTVLGHYKEDRSKSSQALPAEGLLTDNPHGDIPLDRFTGEPDVDRYDRTDYTVGYIADHAFSDALSVRQNLRYYDITLDDVTIFTTGLQADQRTIDRALYESYGDADGLAVDNNVRIGFGTGLLAHNVLAGLDYQTVDAASVQAYGGAPSLDIIDPTYGQAVSDAPVFLDNLTKQRQLGLYVTDRIDIGEALVVSLAARQDWARTEVVNHLADNAVVEQDDEALTFQAGAVYATSLGLAPYANYSESFLPVLGTNPEGAPFDPERGTQYEVGLKYEPTTWNGLVTLAYFDVTRDGYIQYDPTTFAPVQTGEVASRGLEVEATAGLASGLDLVGSLSLMDVEITESVNEGEVGQRPAQTPDRTASLWLDYTVPPGPFGGLGMGFGVRHVGTSYGDVANTVEVPPVTLADATLFYDIGDVQLNVSAQNILDTEYVAAAFFRSSLLATYGQARTVTAGLRYRW